MDTTTFFNRLGYDSDQSLAVVSILRRSLSFEPGQYISAFPVVEPYLYDLSESRRKVAYLAAGLWATAQRRTSGSAMPLAEAFRRVADKRRGESNTASSVDKRFITLLDSDIDELPHRLRQVVSLINAEQTVIDWPALLTDLFAWNAESRHVQRHWARLYWRSGESLIIQTKQI
jgi:CRISPR system Cascade subunit CasB